MTRRNLSLIVRGMWSLLILGFVLMLFSSLTPQHSERPSPDDDSAASMFADVLPGQTVMRRFQGQRVWATRFSDAQRAELTALNSIVAEPQAGCAVTQKLCVVAASSLRDGVEIVHSAAVPPSLASATPWHGGFVDPADGSLYDLSGRAYRPWLKRPSLDVFDPN